MHDGGLCQCNGKILGLMSHWHQIGFVFFSFLSDIALAAFRSNKLVGGPMFNGAAAHPFQNNRISEGPVLSRGTHHASSCLDRAHMGLCCTILCHVFYCILFPINILFCIPLPILSVCPHAHVVIAVTWWPRRPFVTWFLCALTDFFSQIGARN